MCLKIYELVPAKFLSALGLVWQASLKKTEVKLDLLTDTDILLMVEKGIIEEISHSIYQYAKAHNKYMKDYHKKKESQYIQYWNVNNLYGWEMSQKLPLNNFEWIKIFFSLMKISQITIMKKVMKYIFLKLVCNILKIEVSFLSQRIEVEDFEVLVDNLHDKTEYVMC